MAIQIHNPKKIHPQSSYYDEVGLEMQTQSGVLSVKAPYEVSATTRVR